MGDGARIEEELAAQKGTTRTSEIPAMHQNLASLIRDPASVRTWPGIAMRGFSEAAIPDAELSDLIAYLRHMSTRKDQP